MIPILITVIGLWHRFLHKVVPLPNPQTTVKVTEVPLP